MIVMGNLGYDQQIVIRSIPAIKLAFDRMVIELRSAGRTRFRGRKLTREAFANAVWLRLSRMSIPEIEAWLGPEVARFEAMLSGGGAATADEVADETDKLGVEEILPGRRRRRPGRKGA